MFTGAENVFAFTLHNIPTITIKIGGISTLLHTV